MMMRSTAIAKTINIKILYYKNSFEIVDNLQFLVQFLHSEECGAILHYKWIRTKPS
jgi:hypothetical protein